MEYREVVPVIGPGAITFGEKDELLYPHLVQKLAAEIKPPLQFEKPPTDLQDVAFAQLRAGQRLDRIYQNLSRLAQNPDLFPGETLLALASIEAFPFFLTTAFDPLLWRAVKRVSFGGAEKERLHTFSLRDRATDLPDAVERLRHPCVYHIFGNSVEGVRDFVIWDDDALHFLLLLHKQLHGSLPRLADALRQKDLLVLGSAMPAWLLRFFFHVLKQNDLGKSDDDNLRLFVAESLKLTRRHRAVVYFDHRRKAVHILETGHPREFFRELHRRWRNAHPAPSGDPHTMNKAHREKHRSPCCIFVSYVGADLDIARHVVGQLQNAGLHVWFNKEQITLGENWEDILRDAVDQRCGLFLSLISDHSAKNMENYAHFERNIAMQRRERMPDNAIFYIPLRIDSGDPLIPDNEPRGIKKVQGDRKPGGNLDPDFIGQLRDLQNACRAQKNLPPLDPAP